MDTESLTVASCVVDLDRYLELLSPQYAVLGAASKRGGCVYYRGGARSAY